MLKWLMDNKEWVFSGLGVMIIVSLGSLIRSLPIFDRRMSCITTFRLTEKLAKAMEANHFFGLGQPGVILGVSSGGLMVADYFSKRLGSKIPIIALYADISNHPDAPFSKDDNVLNYELLPVLQKFDNFLIIQDIVRTGRTMADLKLFLDTALPSKNYKIICLVTSNRALPQPDYCVKRSKNINFRMPLSDLHRRTG